MADSKPRPNSARFMRGQIVKHAVLHAPDLDRPMTPPLRGAIIGTLNKVFGGDEKRRLVIGWLYNEKVRAMSSKELTEAQWFALYHWIDARYNEDTGKYEPSEDFLEEAATVLQEVVKDYNAAHPDDVLVDNLFDEAGVAVALGGVITKIDLMPEDVREPKADNPKATRRWI